MSLEEISDNYLREFVGTDDTRNLLLQLQYNVNDKSCPRRVIHFIRRLLEKFQAANDSFGGKQLLAYLISIWLARISQNMINHQYYLDKGYASFLAFVTKFVMLFLFKLVRGKLGFSSGDHLNCLVDLLEDVVIMFVLLRSDEALEYETKQHVLPMVGLLISLINNETKTSNDNSQVPRQLHSLTSRSIDIFLSQRCLMQHAVRNKDMMRVHASYVVEQMFSFILSNRINLSDFEVYCESILEWTESISCNVRLDRILEMVYYYPRIIYSIISFH